MGRVDGDCIDCPRHQGRFHIVTGRQLRGPASPPLGVYPVRIAGGRVHVLLPSKAQLQLLTLDGIPQIPRLPR